MPHFHFAPVPQRFWELALILVLLGTALAWSQAGRMILTAALAAFVAISVVRVTLAVLRPLNEPAVVYRAAKPDEPRAWMDIGRDRNERADHKER